jgi:hypothetical protein
MPQHFTVKFVWAAVLLSAIVAAGGSPAFAAQAANSEVRVCQHQAGKIVSSKGPLRLTVSPDGVIAGSGEKTALAAAGPCVAPVAQGGVVTRGVSDQPAVKDAPKKR